MLSVAHLLDALDHLDHFEKKVVQAGNQGMTGPSPTWTTWTTEKQGMQGETDGAERPLSDHAVDDWRCPIGHREFWISAYGLKICSRCHPNPLELRAAWLAGQGQGVPHV